MPTAFPTKTWLKLVFCCQTDAPAAGDHDGFVVEGIVDLRQPDVGTGGGLVDPRWAFHKRMNVSLPDRKKAAFLGTAIAFECEKAMLRGLLFAFFGATMRRYDDFISNSRLESAMLRTT